MKKENRQSKKPNLKRIPNHLRKMIIGRTKGEIKKNTHDILMDMRYGN